MEALWTEAASFILVFEDNMAVLVVGEVCSTCDGNCVNV